jgi:hypothetical protein
MTKKYKVNTLKWVIISTLTMILVLFAYPMRNLFGTSNYFIIKLLYIIFSTFIIWLLYLLLKRYKRKSPFITTYFKQIFFGASVLVAITTGFLHLCYLKLVVIPDSLYCTYYDEYHYKLYTPETGCKELEVITKEIKNGKLVQLSYDVDQTHYERYYENERVIKTIEVRPNERINLNDTVSLKVTKKIVTEYVYQDRLFKQERVIHYRIGDHDFMTQEQFYQSEQVEVEVDSETLYRIEIKKQLKSPTLLMSKSDLMTQIFTDDYLANNNLLTIRDHLADELSLYIDSQSKDTRYFFNVKNSRSGKSNLLIEGDYDFNHNSARFIYGNIAITPTIYADKFYSSGWDKGKELIVDQMAYNNHRVVKSIYGKNNNRGGYRIYEFLVKCNDLENYCDATHGDRTIFRHFIDQDGPITKVETFNVGQRDVFAYTDWIPTTNIQYDEYYFPFDYSVSFSDLFEEPVPFLLIN